MSPSLYLVTFIALKLIIQNAVSDPTCIGQFRPYTRDLRQGRLLIDIKNPTSTTHEYSHFLTCPTLDILAQPRQHITIAGGEIRALQYVLAVSKLHAKEQPDIFEHTCELKRWRVGTSTSPPITCNVKVRTYPGGYFLEKCQSYKGKDLIVIPSEEEAIVRLEHRGDIAHYVANISCIPRIGFAHAEKMYNYLRDGGTWDIQLAPNCSNAIADLDYSGICRLSIYHMCQEQALVTEYRYPYYEGNVAECTAAHAKSQTRQETEGLNRNLEISVVVFVWAIIFFIISIIIRANISMMVNRDFEDDANIPQRSDFVRASLSVCCFPTFKHFSERTKAISSRTRMTFDKRKKCYRQGEKSDLLENEE